MERTLPLVESSAGLGQTLRTGPLVGGLSFHGVSKMFMNPQHIGCPGGSQAPRVFETRLSCSGGGQLLATRTPWVALNPVNSEDPTESTSKQRPIAKKCVIKDR